MLHSLSKILHFTPLSEKKSSATQTWIKEADEKKNTQKKTCNIYEIKNKNDWGQSISGHKNMRYIRGSDPFDFPCKYEHDCAFYVIVR